jgi:hypothetical protein
MPPDDRTLDLREEAKQTPSEEVRVERLTGLQRAGVMIIAVIGVCIIIVTALVAVDWVVGGPPPPANLPPDSQLAQARIEDWQSLREADLERPKQLFELIVQSALLPLFTLIAGYLFGQHTQPGQR